MKTKHTFFKFVLLLISPILAFSETFTTNGNLIHPLRSGKALNWKRLELIDGAEKFIYIKTFIITKDPTEFRVYDALCEKSKSGVDVRMLVDGLGSTQGGNPLVSKDKKYSIEWFKSCGIRFEKFAPLGWGPIDFIMFSQHDKLMVTEDGAITGGTNFSKDYSQHGRLSSHWYDFDIAIHGPAACVHQKIFNTSWERVYKVEMDSVRFNTKVPLKRSEFHDVRDLVKRFSPTTLVRECDATGNEGSITVKTIYNDPYFSDKRPLEEYLVAALKSSLKNLNNSSDKKVRLYAPYFVPTKTFAAALIKAQKAGLHITIITNSISSIDPEAFPAYAAMLQNTANLLKNGIEIRLWNPVGIAEFSHKKSNVFHKKGGCFLESECFIGSHNLDIRGEKYSSELINVISDQEFVQAQIKAYKEDLKYTTQLKEKDRKKLLVKAKLLNRIAGALAGWAM